MQWTCPSCRQGAAVVDFSDGEARVVGCLTCNWDQALTYGFRGGERCVAPKVGGSWSDAGSRCSMPADLGGRCIQHDRNAGRDFHRHFRDYPDDLPQLFRVVFEYAVKLAGVIATDERHRKELLARATKVRVRPEAGPSLVYFVEREGLIKIGVTTNLSKRLNDIGKGSCMPPGMTIGPVTLLVTESGDRGLEQQLHRRFKKSRVSGEWFRPSKALRNYIDDLKRFQQNEDHFLRRVSAA